MRLCLTIAGALFAMTSLGLGPANAFTFENPPGAGAQSGDKGGASGYVDLDPKSVLPPIGESVQGLRYNDTASSYNNGMASPPDPRSSVGPSWLYGR